MSDKPKREYWQVHLSTTVILMVVGGALLPFVIKEVQANTEYAAHFPHDPTARGWSVSVVLFYLLILMGVGGVCEYLIRRREGRKP